MKYLALGALLVSLAGVGSPTRAEGDVLVATFNTGLHDSWGVGSLRYGWVPCVTQRREAQLAAISQMIAARGKRPTILMLQEVWDRDFHRGLSRRAVALGFSLTKWKASKDWGLATLTNGTFVEPPRAYVYPRGWGRWAKGILITRIRFKQRIVTAFNTQMGSSQRKRIDADHQAQLIAAAEILTNSGVAGEPAVFAGDLGTGPDHAYARIDRFDAAAFPEPNYWLWTAFSRNLGSGRPRPWLDLPLSSGVTWDRIKNPLIFNGARRIGREEADFTPDHIFISPGWAEFNDPAARSELFFDQPVHMEWCVEAQKEYGLGVLSNHYGVMAFLHFPVPNHAPVVAAVPAVPPRPAASLAPRRPSRRTKPAIHARSAPAQLAYGPFPRGADPNDRGKEDPEPANKEKAGVHKTASDTDVRAANTAADPQQHKKKKEKRHKTPKAPKKPEGPSDSPTARKAWP